MSETATPTPTEPEEVPPPDKKELNERLRGVYDEAKETGELREDD